MSARRFVVLILVAFVVPATLFAGSSKLTKKEAIRIANETAKQRGIDLSRYDSPDAYYQFTRKDDTWSVFYAGKSLAVGDHFVIIVHDKTKKRTLPRNVNTMSRVPSGQLI